MQICIIAIGTRGDVQPYIALGKGLKSAGYEVRIAAAPNFAGFVREHGLDFAPVGPDFKAFMEAESTREKLKRSSQPNFQGGQGAVFQQAFEQCAYDAPGACQGAGAIVLSTTAFPFLGVAEKMGVPAVWAAIAPMSRTRAFPSFLLSTKSLGGILNGLSHRAAELLIWMTFRQFINRWRKEALGLGPIPPGGPFAMMEKRGLPVLYGYSRHVIPRPADWGERIQVTGYWFLEQAEWQPPAGLVDFLQDGPPPVYIGFGSMTQEDPAQTAALVMKALDRSKQRGVIATNWGGWSGEKLPGSVFLLDSAPHDWLFPQMAAVVHHGGAGTTAAGLRAGVPSIITPFGVDQPFWAERVRSLGAGPKPVARRRLNGERLAEAITRAVTDAEMRRRAAELGRLIRAEDGVGNAVGLMEKLF